MDGTTELSTAREIDGEALIRQAIKRGEEIAEKRKSTPKEPKKGMTPNIEVEEKTETTSWEQDMAARRKAVLWALEEHGTTNTDFLGNNKQIGTHTERPIAFMGESIITENEPSSQTGSMMRPSTPEELASLRKWLRNFPASLKF